MDLSYALAQERPPQIGLIVLQSDETIEPDMRRLMPAEAELLVSRVPSGSHVSSESLAAMAHVLTEAARLLPLGARFAAVGYGCTSGTAQIGAARIRDLVQAGVATPDVTEPVSALVAACGHLGLRRIALISPYVAPVSDRLREVLATAGIAVGDVASFNEAEEAAVARITPRSISDAVRAVAARGGVEGIFLSCTNLRALDVIAEAEASTGLPVLSSNQVLAWHLCRLAGLPGPAAAPGRLWA